LAGVALTFRIAPDDGQPEVIVVSPEGAFYAKISFTFSRTC
jgi:hypothetical protein